MNGIVWMRLGFLLRRWRPQARINIVWGLKKLCVFFQFYQSSPSFPLIHNLTTWWNSLHQPHAFLFSFFYIGNSWYTKWKLEKHESEDATTYALRRFWGLEHLAPNVLGVWESSRFAYLLSLERIVIGCSSSIVSIALGIVVHLGCLKLDVLKFFWSNVVWVGTFSWTPLKCNHRQIGDLCTTGRGGRRYLLAYTRGCTSIVLRKSCLCCWPQRHNSHLHCIPTKLHI